MKSKFVASAVLATLLSGSLARAEGPPPVWTLDGQANFDVKASSLEDYENHLRVQDAEIKFQLLVREGIKVVIKAELEQRLDPKLRQKDFDFQKVIEEAYIQIETDKVSGLPRAIITFGEHSMAFGQKYKELPMFKDALIYGIAKQGEVIGLTVELPHNFFNIVDSVAISIFEAGSNDLEIAKEKGASFRLTKKVSDRLTAQVSGLIKELPNTDEKEKRGSIGLVFNSEDGKQKVWFEGIIVNGNPKYKETTIGTQLGGSYKVGPGSIVLEYQYLQDQAHELAAAYNLPVGTNLILSPEIRRRKDLSGTRPDETVIGIRARIYAHLESKHKLLTGQKKD